MAASVAMHWDSTVDDSGEWSNTGKSGPLTLTLLTWRIWRAPNNAGKWQMGFNSVFKDLSIDDNNRGIEVKNTVVWSAVVSCAWELILIFSLVFSLMLTVHTNIFDLRLGTNLTATKLLLVCSDRCSWQVKNERPTWCHLLFYFTSYGLNMFRTLIYPSSGACDCVDELPHRSSCSQFVVCLELWCGWFRWCSFCRLKHNLCFSL